MTAPLIDHGFPVPTEVGGQPSSSADLVRCPLLPRGALGESVAQDLHLVPDQGEATVVEVGEDYSEVR